MPHYCYHASGGDACYVVGVRCALYVCSGMEENDTFEQGKILRIYRGRGVAFEIMGDIYMENKYS